MSQICLYQIHWPLKFLLKTQDFSSVHSSNSLVVVDFNAQGELLYEHRDRGILGFAANMSLPLSFL
jgi:hypothetical protein